jgi:hypothetical protein
MSAPKAKIREQREGNRMILEMVDECRSALIRAVVTRTRIKRFQKFGNLRALRVADYDLMPHGCHCLLVCRLTLGHGRQINTQIIESFP